MESPGSFGGRFALAQCAVRQALGCLLLCLCTFAHAASPREPPRTLRELEQAYADFNDAQGAIDLIDSDPQTFRYGYAGKERAAWVHIYTARRGQLLAGLARPPARTAALDVRAVRIMRAAVEESAASPESLVPQGRCADAQQEGLTLQPLQHALYACFTEFGNSLKFEQHTVTRVAAFELLTRVQEPERRKALFMAFLPLWRAINGVDDLQSPYRRMLRMAAAATAKSGSPIDAAASTVGVAPIQIEHWLQEILDTWRQTSAQTMLEPWDYRFQAGAAERELGEVIPRQALQDLSERYYRDLGLDLVRARVLYDLDPRPGKAPLAYTDYVRRGRMSGGSWQPTLVRVSASYQHGGLSPLNELVHENGHAAHMLALRTRPAFMDLGDALFYEALADVPAWSVYEPAWQQRYLGRSVERSDSLRALFSSVMLDVAWALFDLRMLRDPAQDPNAVWTAITSRYLRIQPHPEFAWWAARVQLIDKPGYMVNYGLGAVITAQLRARIQQDLGPFDAGEARWYGWLSRNLLSSGEQRPSAQLLRHFLRAPVTPRALIESLRGAAVATGALSNAPAL